MKNFMNKKVSWLQENPNIIGEEIDKSLTNKSDKRMRKKSNKDIKCPKCNH